MALCCDGLFVCFVVLFIFDLFLFLQLRGELPDPPAVLPVHPEHGFFCFVLSCLEFSDYLDPVHLCLSMYLRCFHSILVQIFFFHSVLFLLYLKGSDDLNVRVFKIVLLTSNNSLNL